MSPIFRTPPSLEGHVIQFSLGSQALTTAPSPPSPFSPGQDICLPMPPVRLIRPQVQHADHTQDPRLSIRRGREEESLGSPSGFWKPPNFFPVPVGLSSVPSRPQCGGDDE